MSVWCYKVMNFWESCSEIPNNHWCLFNSGSILTVHSCWFFFSYNFLEAVGDAVFKVTVEGGSSITEKHFLGPLVVCCAESPICLQAHPFVPRK